MGVSVVPGTDLENIDHALCHPGKLNDLVQPHAALLLLTGDLDLNEEIPAAQLFDAPAGLQWEADPIL